MNPPTQLPTPRVTIRDLARSLGLSHAAVSMALRDHPRISPETRHRVREEATLQGYRPEPMLSALAAYRQTRKPSVYHGTLAWLYDGDSAREMFAPGSLFRLYVEGARWRASSLGFHIEEFCLGERNMTVSRMSDILRARGVQGILVAPLSLGNTRLAMRWDWFSAVTFGFSLVEPQLHLVSSAQYRLGLMGTRSLQALGYQRIGFFHSEYFDARTDKNFNAGFYSASLEVPKSRRVPFLRITDDEPPDETRQKIRRWVGRWRIDAVLCPGGLVHHLTKAGYRFPDDFAVALLGDLANHPGYAGVDEQGFRTGVAAIDLIVGMVHRAERGVPDLPYHLLIEGRWVDGASAPPVVTGTAEVLSGQG